MTARVRKLAEIAERYRGSATRSADIARDMQTWLLAEIRTHGVRLPEDRLLKMLEPDVALNTAGLECWLDRSQVAAGAKKTR